MNIVKGGLAIHGRAETSDVLILGKIIASDYSYSVIPYCRDFSWGNKTKGSLQLSLAIMLKYCDNKDIAINLHRYYLNEVISKLILDKNFLITIVDVLAWIKGKENKC